MTTNTDNGIHLISHSFLPEDPTTVMIRQMTKAV